MRTGDASVTGPRAPLHGGETRVGAAASDVSFSPSPALDSPEDGSLGALSSLMQCLPPSG